MAPTSHSWSISAAPAPPAPNLWVDTTQKLQPEVRVEQLSKTNGAPYIVCVLWFLQESTIHTETGCHAKKRDFIPAYQSALPLTRVSFEVFFDSDRLPRVSICFERLAPAWEDVHLWRLSNFEGSNSEFHDEGPLAMFSFKLCSNMIVVRALWFRNRTNMSYLFGKTIHRLTKVKRLSGGPRSNSAAKRVFNSVWTGWTTLGRVGSGCCLFSSQWKA